MLITFITQPSFFVRILETQYFSKFMAKCSLKPFMAKCNLKPYFLLTLYINRLVLLVLDLCY